MIEIEKNINTYVFDIDPKNLTDLYFLFNKYNKIQNYVSNRYSGIKSINLIFNSNKEIRDVWTKNGLLDSFGIPKRYVRNAIDDTIGKIKSNWTNTIKKVKEKIKNNNFNDIEKHYLYKMLFRNNLYNILNNYYMEIDNEFKQLNINKLNNYIKRNIRKELNSNPYFDKFSMMIDDGMYNVNELCFKLSGLNKGYRYKLKLNTSIKLNGNIRLQLDYKKNILKISNVIKTKTIKNNNENIIGIDKNYNNVIESSNGNHYGLKLNEIQNDYTDYLSEKNEKRQYYYNRIKKSTDKKEIDKIKNNNLGKIKYNKKKNKFQEELRKKINKSIKNLINNENPKLIVSENLNFNSTKIRNKKSKNKLNKWVKGIIRKRLEYYCKKYNINYKIINAAYTSQICSSCGHFGDRVKDMFYCHQCGRVVHSGFNAAQNILYRLYDKEIELYTPYKKVRLILEKRLKDNEIMMKNGDELNRFNQDLLKKERIIYKINQLIL